jgi:hypothetical protein
MADKFTPSTFSEAQQSERTTWSEIRELLSGYQADLCARHVQLYYKKSFARGKIRVLYLPLWQYVCHVASPAFALPLRVTGPAAAQKLFRKWRPTLCRAWEARRGAGSAYLHLAQRRGRLLLDMLLGDAVLIRVAPDAPLEWDLVPKVELPVVQQRRLTYYRLANDILATQRYETGFEEGLALNPGWGILPLYPLYRDDVATLQPPPDRTLLDLHIALCLQLSDIEFRRVFRTSKLWRKTQGGRHVKNQPGGEFESAPDAVAELDENEAIGIVESALHPSDDLEYIGNFLRLAAKLLSLPPELFVMMSRAETGAAKSWDYRPLVELQDQDRAQADEWLDGFVEYIRPALEAEGVVAPGEKLQVRTTAPKVPEPVDLLQYAQGLEACCKLGLTTVTREISRREGKPFAEAENLYRENLKANRKLLPAAPPPPKGPARGPTATPPAEPPAPPDDPAAPA